MPQKRACLSFSDVSQFTLLLFQNILEHRRLIILHGETPAGGADSLSPVPPKHHPEGGHTVTLSPFTAIALSLVHESRREENTLLRLAMTTNPQKINVFH